MKTKIGKLSQSWNKIRLRRDGYAHALLQGHWGEMLFNALKYWDHSQKEFLTISFKEKKAGDYKWLQMVWKNPCSGISNRGLGDGLAGINEHLRKLNKTTDDELNLCTELKKNSFVTNLSYRSDILLARSRQKQ